MLWNLLAFTVTVALFHVSEFLLACIFMREELSWRSWLLSKPYCAAMGLAIVEFYAELWLAPGLKTGTWASPDCAYCSCSPLRASCPLPAVHTGSVYSSKQKVTMQSAHTEADHAVTVRPHT